MNDMNDQRFLPPLRFQPILKYRAWGGDRLANLDKDLPAETLIGESWELSDLPSSIHEGQSIVAEGPMAGTAMHELMSGWRSSVLGQAATSAEGRFPLLIKFLDANENLSVQVHPSAAYAAEHEEAMVKSEWWFVIEARPEACVYRGIKPDVTPERFRKSLEDGTALDHLIRIPVRAGECIRLPSGTCHAMGEGIVAAEVQTTSDTTYRVWDWNRNDPDRPLHVEQAMACTQFGQSTDQFGKPVFHLDDVIPVETEGVATRRVCTAAEFTVDHQVFTDHNHEIHPNGRPLIYICLEGAGTLESPEGSSRLQKGDVALVPANGPATTLDPGGRLVALRVEFPAQTGTLLA